MVFNNISNSNTSTNFDISDAVDNILPAIAQQYDDQVADGKIKPVRTSSITDMLDFNGAGGHVRIGETSMMASLSQLKSATYTLTEDQQKTVNEVCSYLNNYYKVFGIDLNASDVADCIYYAYSPQTDTFTNMFGGNLQPCLTLDLLLTAVQISNSLLIQISLMTNGTQKLHLLPETHTPLNQPD